MENEQRVKHKTASPNCFFKLKLAYFIKRSNENHQWYFT